jgi:hypothetical protein
MELLVLVKVGFLKRPRWLANLQKTRGERLQRAVTALSFVDVKM